MKTGKFIIAGVLGALFAGCATASNTPFRETRTDSINKMKDAYREAFDLTARAEVAGRIPTPYFHTLQNADNIAACKNLKVTRFSTL